jgi:hypothetical protein
MTTVHVRRAMAVALFSAGGLCLLANSSSRPALGAQKEQPGAKDPVNPKPGDEVITGFAACRQCHNEKLRPIDPKENDFVRQFKSDQFVLLTEGRVWRQQDPHSSAFKVLSGDLGKQMAKILKYDVTKAPQCLTCHAIDKYPGTPLPKAEDEIAKRFVRVADEGVDCQVCHGLRSSWQSKHYKASEDGTSIPWRIQNPADKEKEGMRNLRDPVVKAKLCASCHVGDPDANRVVTHDMYAAGHPPLPPFEIGTFMNCQPMHWGSPTGAYEDGPLALTFFTDKGFRAYPGGAAIADKNNNWMWDLYRIHPEAKEVSFARAISAGALASLHAEMRLIAADADAVAASNEGFVDFARFDCYACHHDLKYPSDRQKRGYTGAPGRPPLKAWTAALPGVVVEHAATLKPLADVSTGFAGKWDAVHTAALARPFGKPRELADAARQLAEWCEAFMKKDQSVAEPIYNPDEAKKLRGSIAEAAVKKWSADPEAAMHLTWAYIALRNHMKDKIDEKALADLRMVVPVQVRQPRMEMGKPTFSNEKGDPLTVGETLRERLDLFNRFNSKDFTRAFGAITSAPK